MFSRSRGGRLLSSVVVAGLIAGCAKRRPIERHRDDASPAASTAPARAAAPLPPLDSAAVARFKSRLSFDSVSMRLPQPVPEPEGAEERLALPNVPLPPGVEIVLGSEVVAATRDRRRRGTLVNVWATWCGSCEPEMPMLAAIQRRYAARGIELMVVSVDDPAQAETVLRVQHDRGIPGMVRIAHPELGDFKRALSPIWKGALPATFLFDSKGQLRYFWGAQAFEREIVPVLDGLLAGEPIDGLANFQVQGGPRP